VNLDECLPTPHDLNITAQHSALISHWHNNSRQNIL